MEGSREAVWTTGPRRGSGAGKGPEPSLAALALPTAEICTRSLPSTGALTILQGGGIDLTG